jgi:hypothetical protein
MSLGPDPVVWGRRFLISSEKEFKDRHRGDLAGAGLLKQSKVRVHS